VRDVLWCGTCFGAGRALVRDFGYSVVKPRFWRSPIGHGTGGVAFGEGWTARVDSDKFSEALDEDAGSTAASTMSGPKIHRP
jgi:hypothetical protein